MQQLRPLRTESSRSVALERLAGAVLRVPPRAVPAKLGIPAETWDALRGAIDEDEPGPADAAATLGTLWRAMHAHGAGDRYVDLMGGVAFPLEAAGVRLGRAIGPSSPERDAFDAALGRLKLEQHGLVVRPWAAVAGRAVDWAIAGLLPTGEAVKIALVVRAASDPATELLNDLVDDTLAEAGFEVLVFRPWQLKWATAAALAVGERLEAAHPHLRLPRRLHDPAEAPPIHRAQAAPIAVTPRKLSARWAIRQALRAAFPGLGPDALLPHYKEAIAVQTWMSSDDD